MFTGYVICDGEVLETLTDRRFKNVYMACMTLAKMITSSRMIVASQVVHFMIFIEDEQLCYVKGRITPDNVRVTRRGRVLHRNVVRYHRGV